jgi:O-antigen biosynthesis protein
MKKRLRHQLTYPFRMFARRIIVRVVGWVAYVAGDLWNIAVCNGLDVERITRFDVKLNLLSQPQPAPLRQLGVTDGERELSVEDFLFLMDAVSGKLASPGEANKTICASIIIPVFNNVHYTLRCLRSLLHEVDLSENEIIVVDNASTDETARVLGHVKNLVRVVSNEDNLGFVQACNAGAAQARGRYLVFLNNDTEVESDWLENLVETADADKERIGAVGSMLLFPDGRLQEAGCGVWIDGTGFNYGRGGDPEDRRFNYAREVDYCSAASLLVRKDLFDQLGGFDARYAPAYYEDTDLCFGIRSLGYKVIYQPASRLIHYEGMTAGTDTNTGVKRYQEINREKFVEKWKETLRSEHLENDPAHVELAADRRRGARVIIFDREIPTPDQDSGSMRMFMILKNLARHYRPVFVPVYATMRAPKYEKLLGKEGIRVISLADYKDLIKAGEIYAAILCRVEIADALLPTIRKLDPSIKIIFDTVDVHFLRLQREYELTGDKSFAEEAMLRRKQEIQAARLSDQVWCVTQDDKEILAAESGATQIEVVPNIHILHNRGKSFDERDGLLFIGNFNHRPNTDAVHYFIREILPLVQKQMGQVKLYLVGSNMPEEITTYNSESVAVLGYVPDVDSLFQQRRVFVSPLRYGAGMKGKIGQALSYGLPVVTTAMGAEGMMLKHGQTAMIADEPEAFARAVCQAYSDRVLWQELSDAGYKHIQENLSPKATDEKIFTALGSLGKPVKKLSAAN